MQEILNNLKSSTIKEDFLKAGVSLAQIVEEKSHQQKIMAYETIGNEIDNDTHKEWLIEGMSMAIDDDEKKKLMIDSVYQIDLYTNILKETIHDLKSKDYADEIKDAISSMEELHQELLKRKNQKIKFKS